MRILLLINWKIKSLEKASESMEPSNYIVNGEKFWFFRYFSDEDVIDVIDAKSLPLMEKIERKVLHCYFLQFIKCLLRMRKYDLVLAHGFPSIILLSIWKRIFHLKKKIVLVDIGSFCSAESSGFKYKISKFASKSINTVIYHTKKQEDYYKEYFPWIVPKAYFVKFGINQDFYHPLNLKKNNYIICIGASFRDWDTMIEAYKEINCKDVKIKIIGTKLEKYDDIEGVEQIGFLSAYDLRKEIESCLFCILPLVYRNYSYAQMTLLDSMAMGKCVLASRVPSLLDYAIDGESVLFYEAQNVADCAQKMKLLINDKELREKISQKSLETIHNYSEKDMAMCFRNVLNVVLEEK